MCLNEAKKQQTRHLKNCARDHVIQYVVFSTSCKLFDYNRDLYLMCVNWSNCTEAISFSLHFIRSFSLSKFSVTPRKY